MTRLAFQAQLGRAPRRRSAIPGGILARPSVRLSAGGDIRGGVTALSKGRTLRDAISLATTQDAEGAAAYRAVGVGADTSDAEDSTSVLSLSVRPNETFDALALRYATEHGVPLRQAVHEVGKARPDMAAAR